MFYANFNIIHVIYLIVLSLLGVLLYFLLRNRTKGTQNKVMLIIIFTCAVIKVYNMFQYVRYGWYTIFWNLPLYICSLNVFILPWLLISKKRHPIMAHYLSFIAIPGATFSMIFPGISENIYPIYSPVLLEAFYTHAVYITIGLLYIKFNNYTISKKYIIDVALLISVFSFCGHIVNEILIYTKIDVEANYMFTEYGLAGTPLVWLFDAIPIKLVYLLIGYYLMLILRYFYYLLKEIRQKDNLRKLW